MKYKFTGKSNNRQQQMSYILLMIIGSYFHKSVCKAQAMETTLFLHYKELSESRQENLEDKVIRNTEKVLKDYLSLFAETNCEIFINSKEESTILVFETGFETVIAEVDKRGNYQIRVHNLEAA